MKYLSLVTSIGLFTWIHAWDGSPTPYDHAGFVVPSLNTFRTETQTLPKSKGNDKATYKRVLLLEETIQTPVKIRRRGAYFLWIRVADYHQPSDIQLSLGKKTLLKGQVNLKGPELLPRRYPL